jgi:hypothetical protein
VIKRIGLAVIGLWLVELTMSLLFRVLYSVIGVPTGAWMPVAFTLGFAVSAVPYVVAAWLIGRWQGLQGRQLIVTTVIAYLLGIAVGVLVVGPMVTVFLRTNPAVFGANPVFSDYGMTALIGLFGAIVGVGVYWLAAMMSKAWFRPRLDGLA